MNGKRKTARAALALAAVFVAAVLSYSLLFPRRYETEIAASGYADKNLLYAVMKAESGFDERAESVKGARGLMQILPSTAAFVCYLYDLPEGDLLDAAYNIRIGARYLCYLEERFSDFCCVLAAYNAGEGNVREWLKDGRYSADGRTLERIPYAETAKYVRRVKVFYKFYNFFYPKHLTDSLN